MATLADVESRIDDLIRQVLNQWCMRSNGTSHTQVVYDIYNSIYDASSIPNRMGLGSVESNRCKRIIGRFINPPVTDNKRTSQRYYNDPDIRDYLTLLINTSMQFLQTHIIRVTVPDYNNSFFLNTSMALINEYCYTYINNRRPLDYRSNLHDLINFICSQVLESLCISASPDFIKINLPSVGDIFVPLTNELLDVKTSKEGCKKGCLDIKRKDDLSIPLITSPSIKTQINGFIYLDKITSTQLHLVRSPMPASYVININGQMNLDLTAIKDGLVALLGPIREFKLVATQLNSIDFASTFPYICNQWYRNADTPALQYTSRHVSDRAISDAKLRLVSPSAPPSAPPSVPPSALPLVSAYIPSVRCVPPPASPIRHVQPLASPQIRQPFGPSGDPIDNFASRQYPRHNQKYYNKYLKYKMKYQLLQQSLAQ